ncbi:MAG: sugar phosphate isomerase/epimerase family protein [Verrucomicrobiota bacterium]
MNRRTALKTLATGAALPLLGARAHASVAPRAETRTPPSFALGVATVSLKSLPLANMLEAVKRVGLEAISLHRAHSPWENQPGQWAAAAATIRAAGVRPLCCGVLYLKDDEPAMRRMMDYVKAHGLDFFSCSPEPAALPLLEKLVREYDLRCAIHNHGPEDKSWPSVGGVLQALKGVDERVGLCLDVGHCYRSGEDPGEMIRRHHTRIYDVHLKDTVAAVGDRQDTPVEMGRGRLDLHAILRTLVEVKYSHAAWLEYEKDPNDPVAGLAESAGYIRGLLRGLA